MASTLLLCHLDDILFLGLHKHGVLARRGKFQMGLLVYYLAHDATMWRAICYDFNAIVNKTSLVVSTSTTTVSGST